MKIINLHSGQATLGQGKYARSKECMTEASIKMMKHLYEGRRIQPCQFHNSISQIQIHRALQRPSAGSAEINEELPVLKTISSEPTHRAPFNA